MSSVVRVPGTVHNQAKQLAGMRGQQPGEVIAEAWAEYIENHRGEFASDLEEAARVLREGTLDELATFASRNVESRAKAAADALRSNS